MDVDRKVTLRLFDLIKAVVLDLLTGMRKPKPLKHLAPGVWSRRLTHERRLVYLVRNESIDFLQTRYHG